MERARLIQILRCPITMQLVREATPEEISDCNRRIVAGEIRKTSGEPRSDSIQTGLLREDGAVLFPIENGIPVMLAEEALVLR
ncbi:MAG: hypothetical protein ABIT76_03935 [Chthoniobacterales bacterium]